MAKGKRITVEDLWKLDRSAQPSLSPDGAQACVSVSAYDMKDNKGRASLWLLSAFGGEPRRLTTMGEKDGEPKWSPDGRWIAFVAKRPAVGMDEGDDEPQVYLIAPDGGEARRLTDISTDGGEIAFGFEPGEDKRFDRELELMALDLKSGKFRSLSGGTRLSHEFPRYSPDGRHIALLTQDLKKSPRAPYRVALVDRAGGKVRVLPTRWDGTIHPPLAWTGDSKGVLFGAEDHARTHLFRW